MENTIINNDCMKVFVQIAYSSVNLYSYRHSLLTLTDLAYLTYKQ